MKLLWIFALAVVVGAAGCGTGESNVVAPKLQTPGGPNFRAATIYTSCGTYTASYPNGFVGPMPDGYCQQNGTGIPSECTIGAVVYRGATMTMEQYLREIGTLKAGDPTSDD